VKIDLGLNLRYNFANQIVSVLLANYNVKENIHGLTLNAINTVVANQFKAHAINVELDQNIHNNLILYAKPGANVLLVNNVKTFTILVINGAA